jgi:hypothetical protein
LHNTRNTLPYFARNGLTDPFLNLPYNRKR